MKQLKVNVEKCQMQFAKYQINIILVQNIKFSYRSVALSENLWFNTEEVIV